ncbi:hypothetical protein PMI07_006404 [Rhizobium sp. CF080]|uniref:hypothetical protein n=1 Tax=Rhizobium sp. (strain CF080) TaxID=1144310 RepID=UPI000271A39B|nr:hypothetical protein [Rhizobium sp. CF080]EUB98090.1 hypothetical protein PMI07_006404 [Rhizobium sp. CF080]
MLSDIAAWLFAIFVINPLHAELRERVDLANLPVQALQQSRQCVAAHGPQLLEQAGNNPGWATGTAIGIAVGWSSPVHLFDARDPNCSVLIQLFNAENRREAEGRS